MSYHIMHEKYKADLNKMGTSHHTESPTHEHSGISHKELHAIEGEHLMGKKHRHTEEI
jgi:hypothetical protein